MLVLSRKKDTSVMIGDNIEVVVVDCGGGRVRLGIKAPKNVSVHRKEVFESIRLSKESGNGDLQIKS